MDRGISGQIFHMHKVEIKIQAVSNIFLDSKREATFAFEGIRWNFESWLSSVKRKYCTKLHVCESLQPHLKPAAGKNMLRRVYFHSYVTA